MSAYGLRVFLDGAEVDCELIGNIRTNAGGFGPLRQGRPHTLSMDVYAKWDDTLAGARTCTVVMVQPDGLIAVPTDVWVNGGGEWEHVIFQGTVGSRAGHGPSLLGPDLIQYNFIGDESNIFNRRPNIAANANSGYQALISAAATALSVPDTGYLGFPTPGYNFDRPASDNETFGAYAVGASAAYGSWITCEWDWDGSTAPAPFVWRPSVFQGDAVLTRQELITITGAWQLEFVDVGVQYSDFVANIVVTGEDSGGGAHTGSDQLAVAGDRANAGHRSATVSTWLDTNAGCTTAATNLINRTGKADTNKLRRGQANMDHYYTGLITQGDGTPEGEAAYFGHAKIGDQVQWVFPTTFPTLAHWPADADTLENEIIAAIGYAKYSSVISLVTGVDRVWTPTGGWSVALELDPI